MVRRAEQRRGIEETGPHLGELLEGMLQRTALFLSPEELEGVVNSTVAIAGLGGVGCICAELMARMGVRRLRLLDRDRYEPTNLNRQLFALPSTLGRPKAEVAAERIRQINPGAHLEMVLVERVTAENARRLVEGATLLIQTTDSPTSALLYRACRELRVPAVNGYCWPTGCRVQALDYRRSRCYGLFDRLKDRLKWRGMKPLELMSPQELDQVDARLGHGVAPTLGFVTNLCGCLIVAEAVKLLTGRGRPCAWPRYLELDVFAMKLRVRDERIPRPAMLRRAWETLVAARK